MSNTIRLGDAATYINGYAFKPEDRGTEGLPIIRIQDLTGNAYDLGFYSGEYPEKIEINNGDVLISWSASLGVYIWDKGKALLNQHIFKVVFDKVEIDKQFFVYAVHYKLREMESKTHGATMKHIVKREFDNIKIPYPNMETQCEIADKIAKVESAIKRRKEELQLLDSLIKSRFVEMFGDTLCNDKGWPIYTLDTISSSRLGKMLDAKRNTGRNSFPYLANFNVQWFEFDLSELHEMDFNDADREEFSLKDGDLLVTEGGEVGRCAIWHNEVTDCYFQKALHRVRCDKNIILPEYLAWWFKFHSDFNGFEDIVGGKATIAHLPGVKLKKLQIEVPDINVQKDFVSFWREIDKLKSVGRKSIGGFQTLLGNLMQKYFG